jgi:dihydrofolate reductase
MRPLTAFLMVSLDHRYADAHGDMRWAHRSDPEWDAYVAGNMSTESELVFGRITYEMMAGYWPSELARSNDPEGAARMNAAPKVVFSNTLREPAWQNTRHFGGDIANAVTALKAEHGPAMAILGSGSVVAQCASLGLLDELTLVTVPVVIGAGPALFEQVNGRFELSRGEVRAFGNGNVVTSYRTRSGP